MSWIRFLSWFGLGRRRAVRETEVLMWKSGLVTRFGVASTLRVFDSVYVESF